jgi:hypothetical protein
MSVMQPKTGKGEIVLYQTSDGLAALEVPLDQDTVWLTQRQMAELFEKDTDTIGLHIRNLYKEGALKRGAIGELERKAVVAIFATTASDGKTYRGRVHVLKSI